jgi:hypothetical protein
VLFLVVAVDFKKLFKHDMLWRPVVLALVEVELNEQVIKVFTFEVNIKGAPVAMIAAIVEELLTT